MRNDKLISVVKNPFALALSSRQTSVIKDFHFGTNQNMLSNVLGNATGYCLVVLRFIAWPPFHLKDHVITTVFSPFEVYLELAAYFRDL